jgi:hypothetical protein
VPQLVARQPASRVATHVYSGEQTPLSLSSPAMVSRRFLAHHESDTSICVDGYRSQFIYGLWAGRVSASNPVAAILFPDRRGVRCYLTSPDHQRVSPYRGKLHQELGAFDASIVGPASFRVFRGLTEVGSLGAGRFAGDLHLPDCSSFRMVARSLSHRPAARWRDVSLLRQFSCCPVTRSYDSSRAWCSAHSIQSRPQAVVGAR